MPDDTTQLETAFEEAIFAGDTEAAQSLIVNIAVRNPARAEHLVREYNMTLRVAVALKDAGDEALTDLVAEGDGRLKTVVDYFRQAAAADGLAEAIRALAVVLREETDHSLLVAVTTAAVIREHLRLEPTP